MSVSMTFWSRMSELPVHLQSTPSRGLPSSICRDLTSLSAEMGERPEFSASAIGKTEKNAHEMLQADLMDQMEGATKNREKKAAFKAQRETEKADASGCRRTSRIRWRERR